MSDDQLTYLLFGLYYAGGVVMCFYKYHQQKVRPKYIAILIVSFIAIPLWLHAFLQRTFGGKR